MELFPNVHCLNLRFVNVYLCVDGGEVTMIDAGIPRQTAKVLRYLQKLGLPPQSLKQILITHADIDHVGSLAELVKMTGAKVLASAGTATLLHQGTSPDRPSLIPYWMQRIARQLMRYQPISQVQIIQNGQVLPYFGGITVLATPGHTSDHHSFYSPNTGILFTGDALNSRHNHLNRTPPQITVDQNAADQSAQRLLELNPTFMACGHGIPLPHPTNGTWVLSKLK